MLSEFDSLRTALGKPFPLAWNTTRPSLAKLEHACRRAVQRRLDAISGLAESIATRDEEDAKLIRENKNAIADKLAGVSKNKKAAQAYAGPRKSGPRYQDREA